MLGVGSVSNPILPSAVARHLNSKTLNAEPVSPNQERKGQG